MMKHVAQDIGRPAVDILLVEDNPGDVRLTQEALKDARVHNRLNVVCDGEEAMAYLHRDGAYAGASRPDIVLLDLNLPKKDGRQVLVEAKADPALKRIPIIVLTTSKAESDITFAYDAHANCYIVKPVDLDRFFAVAREIESFWLSTVALPSDRGD
jgi:two-component system, chemotaxis family, response regulator Rcp1